MDGRFFGPLLAEERIATLVGEADAWRAGAEETVPPSPLRAHLARTLVAVALRLWPAVMDGWTRREDDDAPVWWEFDAPRGVFC